MGNKYFENKDEHAGRDRWVDYGQVSLARSLVVGFTRKVEEDNGSCFRSR